jgi:Rha family phage regulatory protein
MNITGLSIIGEDVMVDTLHIAAMTKRDHSNVLNKFRKFDKDCEELGLLNFYESSNYINDQGKEQPYIIMNSDTSLKFLSTFTKTTGLVVIDKLIKCVNDLKDALRKSDKKNKELIARYRLTDIIDCSNLSSISGRFDLTPQASNKILCDQKVLKRIKNGNTLIYRLTAGYLGKGLCNIDQDTEDLKTHLKWSDKEGIAFLSEFFEIEKAKNILRQREIELRNHPVLPNMESYL